MKRTLVFAAVLMGALAIVGLGIAGLNRNTSVHLSSQVEVPVCCESQAQGQAIFRVSPDGDSIDYKLIVANLDNAFMAHIHVGQPGGTGPIGVWLFPSTTPGQPGPLGAGRKDGPIAEGTITAANLVGPLTGRPLADLVTLLDNGRAYVNVHTNDGVAPVTNQPGDIPAGEIRGNTGG